MFGRSKKPVKETPGLADRALEKITNEAIDMRIAEAVEKRIKKLLILEEPVITLHKSTGLPYHTDEYDYSPNLTRSVPKDRWYATVGKKFIVGKYTGGDLYSEVSEGYATAAAAEKAAKEWYESLPVARVRA